MAANRQSKEHTFSIKTKTKSIKKNQALIRLLIRYRLKLDNWCIKVMNIDTAK